MATTKESEAGRVSKTEFVQRVARRANMSVRSATAAYNAIFGEIADLVANGNRVTLTGFGKFYAQEHKGHEVRFSGRTARVRSATTACSSSARRARSTRA